MNKIRLSIKYLLQAILIAPLHGATQGFVWQILIWYFLADLVFGVIAYATNSILPGLTVHIAGLIFFFAVVWPRASTISVNPGLITLTAILFVISILALTKLKKIAAKI